MSTEPRGVQSAELRANADFAIELITLYHPGRWGVATEAELQELARRDPLAVWTRMLDEIQEAGFRRFEMTFAPGNLAMATAAYGSLSAFRRELERRDLSVLSGFWVTDWNRPDEQIIADGAAAAEGFAELGAEVLVSGSPLRATRGSEPPTFVTRAGMERYAEVLNHVGWHAHRAGLSTAIHSEAHSMIGTRRDLDLVMLLTDPYYVGLCPDAAHITLFGGDPVDVATRYADRIELSHWKDAGGPMGIDYPMDYSIHVEHEKHMRGLGAGAVDWEGWARAMSRTKRPDVVLLELDAVADPVAEMVAGRRFAEEVRRRVGLA